MTDDQLEAGIASSQAAMDMLYEQRQALDKKIDQHRSKNERLIKEKVKRQVGNMQASGKTDWALLLTFAPYEPYYEALQKAIKDRFPDMAVVNSGYHPEVMQYALRIGLQRCNQEQVKRVAAFLEEVLPAMKVSIPEKNLYKFEIMDRGLSEYETYFLICTADTKQWSVVSSREFKRGRENKHGPFAKVEDALQVISTQYWYTSADGDEEEE
jgi:hypothetical protein